MPRKSKSKKLNWKQKKLLARRLIEISMKIDDFVYKNKTISIADAIAYIGEMSTCKLLCCDDARSLQVIEKITRCMNAIIAEHQETKEVYPSCPSPVYSLPDEDRTYFSQIALLNGDNEPNVLDKANGIETIDLCNHDVTTAQKITVDVEIHRAMSSLSFEENEDSTAEPCSQSILNGIDTTHVEHLINTPNCITQHAEKIQNDSNKPLFEIPKATADNAMKRKPKSKEKEVLQQVHSNTEIKHDSIIDITEDKVEKIKRKKKINNNNKEIKKNNTKRIKNKTLKDNKKTTNTQKDCKVNKISYDHLYSKVNYVVTPAIAKNTIETKKPLQIVNAQLTDANMHKKNQLSNTYLSDKVTDVTNPISNISIENIYNSRVINDLSWVENIRYVREINSEENDRKLAGLDDTFWDNFSLPSFWDDKDFDY